jgi:hypothetical protein
MAAESSYKVAVMQPYFWPYLGYFHLMDAVDELIILDDVNHSKGSWVNRNRIPIHGAPSWVTVPIAKSDQLLSDKTYQLDSRFFTKLRRKLSTAYPKSHELDNALDLIKVWQDSGANRVVDTNVLLLKKLGELLPIVMPRITLHSSLGLPNNTDRVKRIIQAVRAVSGDIYVNLQGGIALYRPSDFSREGIPLHFIRSSFQAYGPPGQPFIERMSAIDLLLREPRNRSRWSGPESYQVT